MKDENLEKAKKALKDWSDRVTVDEFVESHKKLGLVKPTNRPPDLKLLYAIFSMIWMMPLLLLTALCLVDQQSFRSIGLLQHSLQSFVCGMVAVLGLIGLAAGGAATLDPLILAGAAEDIVTGKQKADRSPDWSLQLDSMKSESLVIASVS